LIDKLRPSIADALGRISDGASILVGGFGASGLRMLYEMYLQLLGRAGPRQRKQPPVFGLTHNLGGFPHQNVSSISIVGRYGA
jgi:acetyl-CoA C-acetyltransferase